MAVGQLVEYPLCTSFETMYRFEVKVGIEPAISTIKIKEGWKLEAKRFPVVVDPVKCIVSV